MNTSTSQSSGDCESGWTRALEQWQGEVQKNYTHTRSGRAQSEEGEEEDLSMVSDASSGPPFYEAEEDSYNENGRSSSGPGRRKLSVGGDKNKKEKAKEHGREEEQQHLFCEDTATSIPMSFTKKKYSPMDNDAAKAKGKSALEKYHIERAGPERKGGLKGRKLR